MRPLRRLRVDLLVLVRNGNDGTRLARVEGTCPLIVRKWMTRTERWGAAREMPERDLLGLPDEDDGRVRAARKARAT